MGPWCKRSNIKDFWPALGGARSWGMVSAAPGGGTCCRREHAESVMVHNDGVTTASAYRRAGADYDGRRQRAESGGRAAAVGALGLASHAAAPESVGDAGGGARVAKLGLGGERGVIGMGGVVGRQRLVAGIVQGRGGGRRCQDGRLSGIPCGSVRRRCSVLRILILLGGLARILTSRELFPSPRSAPVPRGAEGGIGERGGSRLTTLAPKRFIFEDNSFSSVGD